MITKVRAIVSKTFQTAKDAFVVPQSQTGTDSARSESELYECPQCETVYIATDTQTCSRCRVTVEPVGNF